MHQQKSDGCTFNFKTVGSKLNEMPDVKLCQMFSK